MFNLVGFEQMGPTTSGILKIAELIDSDDPIELLMKVSRLIRNTQNDE